MLGGGTGGHVYPLVAVAQQLKIQSGNSVELLFMGDGPLIKEEAEKIGLKCRRILAPKWRRYFSLLNLLDIVKFPISFFQSLFFVWQYMPDLIFAKGGYAALMPALIGKLMAIPVFIHETDAIPGVTNKFLSKFAKKTFVSLDASLSFFTSKNIETVGNPIRQEILQNVDRSTAASAFKLDPNKPTILITGANQGAKIINDTLLLALIELVNNFQIIHQTGPKNFTEIDEGIKQLIEEGKNSYGDMILSSYRVYPVLDARQMSLAYSASDVIVSRSGSQIFETAAIGKPTVLIPLKKSGGNHQEANAMEIAKFGALVIEEENLTPHMLINEIRKVYDRRENISSTIRQFARLDAASTIASQLLSY
jgi:UDP-N-acetylglucosamine--N-acetylmuramyl-(pentapeptide) pyrophosphoryl-undecaprenol N-acetylglucosamine transferase